MFTSAEAAGVSRARSLCGGQRAGGARVLLNVSDCYEQHLAGQGGRGGQSVEEQPARDGVVAHGPQQQAVVQGQVAIRLATAARCRSAASSAADSNDCRMDCSAASSTWSTFW